jgi:biopolymer transport protein TolQ
MDPTLAGQVVDTAVQVAPQHASLFEMITSSGPVVQLVLYSLVILSIACWTITIQKILQFNKASKDTDAFTNLFWDTKNFARIDDGSRRLTASPLTRVFASGYRELISTFQENEKSGRKSDVDFELIERALRRAEIEESARLEKGVTFLATTASAAPFIGLFGTVWGIMNAFHGLGDAKSSTLQAVAPGISEALVATAVGLAAAIPAAIAFNFFTVTIKRFRQSMSGFSSEFINVAKKSFAR